MIYTLVGSLLMLAGAVALGVLAAADGGDDLVLARRRSRERPLGEGTQQWIFLLFAAAFLVKAPAFPLHGWVVDTYRATPIPVLMVLSAVLSKLGVYGFLRVVLPILPGRLAALPGADDRHRGGLDPVRVDPGLLPGRGAPGGRPTPRSRSWASSCSGIFSLDPKGAQGALMQMVNHGLVVAPLFFIIAMLTARAGGRRRLRGWAGSPSARRCSRRCS